MKEVKSQKNFKISIRAKILTGMIACVLIVTNLIGWFFIVQAKDTLLEQCKKNARNSAKIAAERIDGDILEQIKAGDEKTENYKEILFNSELPMYLKNTFIIWMMGFIPQMFFSLLLASWFTDLRLRLKCSGFFKTVIYMPNLIMASAFSMLFYTIFSDVGPINNLLNSMGLPTYRFLAEVAGARGLIALMNFLMWFGNTTIVLMAGIMGIDTGIMEAARIDGASSFQIFRKITLPIIKPIMAYTLVTSLIGGIQMFDVPQILTNGNGNPDRTSMTAIMYLNKHLYSKNYGMAGALSVILFIITAVLSIFVFKYVTKDMVDTGAKTSKKAKK